MITLAQIKWELILGGLALFLFGISLMGDGLTNFAGTKIRDYIEKYTSKPWKAILVGIILTSIIQSSSATTVIAISLVRAGLMRLDQAIGITMGANIGTTVTAVLIGLNMDVLAYYILFFGIVLLLAGAKKKTIHIAHIIIGFSLVFIGLDLMGAELGRLPLLNGFNALMISMANQPIIALIGGTIVTGVVQSSSAVVGITQKLYDVGAITLLPSIALVFGANIGTCVTAIIASIGGSLAARRASFFHLLFNVIGSIIFMVFLVPYSHLIHQITLYFSINSMMEIAVAHFVFNVVATVLFAPFIQLFVKLMETIIPGKDASSMDMETIQFDESMISALPAAALASAKKSISKMGELVLSSINSSFEYLTTKNRDYQKQVNQLEEIINSLDTKLVSYLLKIAKTTLDEESANEYAINMQVTKNLERISDLAQNLVEYYELIFDAKEELNEDEMREINQVYELLIHNTTQALEIFNTNNVSSYNTLSEDENYMDLLEYQFREAHFQRISVNKNQADVASSMYIDILGTIERMADHSYNIATTTINPIKFHYQTTSNNE